MPAAAAFGPHRLLAKDRVIGARPGSAWEVRAHRRTGGDKEGSCVGRHGDGADASLDFALSPAEFTVQSSLSTELPGQVFAAAKSWHRLAVQHRPGRTIDDQGKAVMRRASLGAGNASSIVYWIDCVQVAKSPIPHARHENDLSLPTPQRFFKQARMQECRRWREVRELPPVYLSCAAPT